MDFIRKVITANETLKPGSEMKEYILILDSNAGTIGYEQVKLVMYVNGKLPAGAKMTVFLNKNNIGVIEKVVLELTADLLNGTKVLEGVIEKAHLADTIRCIMNVKRDVADFTLSAMVQLSDVADNILGGNHEMFMVKR